MKYDVFMSQRSRTIKILISKWSRTRKFSQLFKNKGGGKIFSYHGHALVTLYVQFLCSDWSKFGRWVHAENLCSILNLVYFDSWSWQSFVSTCDVFNCLFLLDVQNEIQLLSKVRRLSKSEIRFRMASFLFFTSGLAWCVRGFKSLKLFWPYLMKSIVVYAASLCTFVRFETMVWHMIRFDKTLQHFKKPLDIFSHRK